MTVLSKPLPLEIWINIVELHDRRADASTLRALSRCCRALACLCQQILFRDLHIPRGYHGLLVSRPGALARLEYTFTQSPHLATFVRKVRYTIEEEDSENTTVHWILNQLTRDSLASVHMEYVARTPYRPHLDWDTLDTRLRSSIMHLVKSPRLKSLSLSWIKNMPSSLFVSLSSDLTKVRLYGVEVKLQPHFDEFEGTNSDVTPRRVDVVQTERRLPHINNLHYNYHDTGGVLAFRPFVFDFEQLRFLCISWGNEPQCALGKELMKAANKLEGLVCVVDCPQKSTAGLAQAILDYNMDVSLTALTIALAHKTAMPTTPDPDEYDLFLGLIEELELLAGKNTMKHLMVRFDTTKEAHDRLTGCLRRFDEIVTREAFPHLERFELEICIHCLDPSASNVAHSAPNTQHDQDRRAAVYFLAKDLVDDGLYGTWDMAIALLKSRARFLLHNVSDTVPSTAWPAGPHPCGGWFHTCRFVKDILQKLNDILNQIRLQREDMVVFY
ncbi:unnamed protein product [Cyclocybe aegerita]|uniref:F-box domain-containing protein n=1 Tax=Cyclocybe aegerita TaxID=1973307 RepID=A0A8S0WX94_CYCAE|nr:unnamed protein product [Cyclocybe aegerita]